MLNHKYCSFHNGNLAKGVGAQQPKRKVVSELNIEPASSLPMSKFLWAHYTPATNQASWSQGQLRKHARINGMGIHDRPIPPPSSERVHRGRVWGLSLCALSTLTLVSMPPNFVKSDRQVRTLACGKVAL